MKIVHIYNTIFPPKDSAGAERVAHTLINAQKELEHDVRHIRKVEELSVYDIETTEVFHYHSIPDFFDSACNDIPEIKKRSVITQHGFHWKEQPGFDKMVENADRIVYLSEPHMEYHKGKYIAHNFVNCNEYEYNNSPDDYLFWIGGTDWWTAKSLPLLLNLAATLGFKLVIAGSGNNKAVLQEIAGYTIRYPNIKHIGMINGEEKAKWFKNAAATLLFPTFDAFTVTALESLAHGVPLIVCSQKMYPLTMFSEIFDSSVAVFNDSVIDLKRNIASKVYKKIDRQKCREFIENGFTAIDGAKNYLNLYETILHNIKKD